MSPLDAARRLLDEPTPGLRSSRTSAAALLVRQALEAAVDAVWAERAPAMTAASDRAQQITLAELLDDDGLGQEVAWAWSRLSHLCHHRAYELAPAAAEVRHLIAVVERLRSAAA